MKNMKEKMKYFKYEGHWLKKKDRTVDINPALVKTLKQGFSETIAMANDNAYDIAKSEDGIPQEASNAHSYVGTIRSRSQNLMAQVDLALQVSEQEKLAIEDEQREIQLDTKELDTRISSLEHDLKIARNDQGKLNDKARPIMIEYKKWKRFGTPLSAVFLLGEGLFSSAIFQILGFSKIESMLIGFVCASAILLIVHELASLLKGDSSPAKKVLLVIGVGLLLGAFFIGQNKYRTMVYDNPNVFNQSHYLYLVINIILIVATFMLVYSKRPSKQKMDVVNQWKGKQQEVDEIDDEIEELKERKIDKEAEVKKRQKEFNDAVDYYRALKSDVNSNWSEAYYSFINHYRKLRKGAMPKFFDQAPEPIKSKCTIDKFQLLKKVA